MGSLSSGDVGAVSSLTGQCGVDNLEHGVAISGDGALTYSVSSGPDRRAARFRFFGTQGVSYTWDSYDYRYAVAGGTGFGPSSNEIVRFGRQRNDPDDAYWWEYASPDDHNSNVEDDAPNQDLPPGQTTPIGDHEIWVKAIFDVPSNPDPSCWTNAVQVNK